MQYAYIRILLWKISLLDGVSAKCNQNNLNSVRFWMQMLKEAKVIDIFKFENRGWNFASKIHNI